MKVGKSVSKSIDDWMGGDSESAILHACNAIDGTANKLGAHRQNRARFVQLLRENYDLLGPMGAPGINLVDTRFPVRLPPTNDIMAIDIADLIYRVHRCTHGHGDELPDGFDLLPDAAGPVGLTRMLVERGKVRLSDRIIFGLLTVAVASPQNSDEVTTADHHLTFGADHRLVINEVWGNRQMFLRAFASVTLPSVKLDFTDWYSEDAT